MLKFSRILFPVAFSERCRGAARYAGALACHFHAELVLLHVVAPPPSIFGGPEAVAYPADLFDGMLDKSKADLEAFLAEELQGLNVTRVVLEGDPARTIIQYAHAERFDLIVMPTHGYGPFRRFLLGSVTAKVLHDADCPVWTGPHMEQAPARESLSLRQIVCAVDLGPRSQAIVDWRLEWRTSSNRTWPSFMPFLHPWPVWETFISTRNGACGWQAPLESAFCACRKPRVRRVKYTSRKEMHRLRLAKPHGACTPICW